MREYVACGHLMYVLDRENYTRADYINKAIEQLRNKHLNDPFDTLIVCGYSGVIVGSIVAHILNVDLTIVRKMSEQRHSYHTVEGRTNGVGYILDDFISSGETVKFMLRQLKLDAPKLSVAGAFLWRTTSGSARTNRMVSRARWLTFFERFHACTISAYKRLYRHGHDFDSHHDLACAIV